MTHQYHLAVNFWWRSILTRAFLHVTVIPLSSLWVMLKQSRRVLHLGFFDAWGLKNAKTFVTSASTAGVERRSCVPDLKAGVSASAGDTRTPNNSTSSSLSTLWEEGSLPSREVGMLSGSDKCGMIPKVEYWKKWKLWVCVAPTKCCGVWMRTKAPAPALFESKEILF